MKTKTRSYYDKFSRVYDWLSPKSYYHKARQEAVNRLDLQEGQTVLNVPIGTGQNLEYFQRYLNGTGKIIGVDLSEGMLSKAFDKVQEQEYPNVVLHNSDVSELNAAWIRQNTEVNPEQACLFLVTLAWPRPFLLSAS